MPPFRRSFRRGMGRRFSRRGPPFEVSQFSQEMVIEVAPNTSKASPAIGFVPLIGQRSMVEVATAIPTNWRGISVRGILMDSIVLQTNVVSGVLAAAEIAEHIHVSEYEQGDETTPTRIFNGFAPEIGIVGSGQQENITFPKRILQRRWGAMQVGSGTATTWNIRMHDTQTWAARRIRTKVYLRDTEAIWAQYCFTNPTLITVIFVVEIRGAIAYRIRQ